jgi:hypothetical protein
MTAPFNKIADGLVRARHRQAEWRSIAAQFPEGTPRGDEARRSLDFYRDFIRAEGALLMWLRRRWRVYAAFAESGVSVPAELRRYHEIWTAPSPRQPPTQLRLPL